MFSEHTLTTNASIERDILIYHDITSYAIKFTKASGMSLGAMVTPPYKFSDLLGDYGNQQKIAQPASFFFPDILKKQSVILGSGLGYGLVRNTESINYRHPIHWTVSGYNFSNPRYPRGNALTEGTGNSEERPTWQVALYDTLYLGSESSCLIRGSDFGRNFGDTQWMWALVPPRLRHICVTQSPSREGEHIINSWRLFSNGTYVMTMTAGFCGTGHTTTIGMGIKSYNTPYTSYFGPIVSGFNVYQTPEESLEPGADTVLDRVVMEGVTPKPVPTVTTTPDITNLPAAGTHITLETTSTLEEPIYLLNDTMCGHDPSLVWCRQSAECIPETTGTVTLTIATNTTGQSREAWIFVGHHYAQAAVVKIIQQG